MLVFLKKLVALTEVKLIDDSPTFECMTNNRMYYRDSGSSSFCRNFLHSIVEEEKMLCVHLYKSLKIKFYH